MNGLILRQRAEKIKHALWLLSYRLEELRQHYATTRQHVKRTATSLALIVLRMGGAHG